MKKTYKLHEEWRSIEGFPNYEVSSRGRVRRIRVTIAPKGGRRPYVLPSRILRKAFSTNGWMVSIPNENGVYKSLTIARAMLTAFVRPPFAGEMARHLDDNKRNQQLDNLAWGTQKDNSLDCIRNGHQARGEKLGTSKLKNNQVLDIKRSFAINKESFSSKAFADKYNVTESTINYITSGYTWKHIQI